MRGFFHTTFRYVPQYALVLLLALVTSFSDFQFYVFWTHLFETLTYTTIHSAAVDEFENQIQVVYYLSCDLCFDGLVLCCAGIK